MINIIVKAYSYYCDGDFASFLIFSVQLLYIVLALCLMLNLPVINVNIIHIGNLKIISLM